MTRAERLAALQERMWQIAMGTAPDAMPVQVTAAVAFLNRELGLPRQSMELSGANGEAIKHDVSITVSFVTSRKDHGIAGLLPNDADGQQ